MEFIVVVIRGMLFRMQLIRYCILAAASLAVILSKQKCEIIWKLTAL